MDISTLESLKRTNFALGPEVLHFMSLYIFSQTDFKLCFFFSFFLQALCRQKMKLQVLADTALKVYTQREAALKFEAIRRCVKGPVDQPCDVVFVQRFCHGFAQVPWGLEKLHLNNCQAGQGWISSWCALGGSMNDLMDSHVWETRPSAAVF